jgi:hypothetical protein
MRVKSSKSITSDYKYFKAIIGTISEEFDYFGNPKEVLSLDNVCSKTRGNKPVADYVLINKNKSTESLFEIARQGLINQEISFYGKILDYKEVQLYEGMNFLRNESHCKIGYIKNLNIHFENTKTKQKGSKDIRHKTTHSLEVSLPH